MTGQYHYHVEPLYLTTSKGKGALLGFLLDGFPVYGPLENGKTLTDSDLDALHGHTSVTTDYPNGIYHYHITAAAPYINGDGFFGTAGTVTNWFTFVKMKRLVVLVFIVFPVLNIAFRFFMPTPL